MSNEIVLRVIEEQRAQIRVLQAELDAFDARMKAAMNAILAGHSLPPLPEPASEPVAA